MGGRERRQPWRYRNATTVTESRKATPRSVQSVQSHPSPARVVRVRAKGGRRPFSLHDKFARLEELPKERAPDPYLSEWEKRIQEENASRQRWIDGAFTVTDHKAAVARRERQVASSACVTASGAYVPRREYFRETDKSKFVGPRGFIF